MFMCAYYPNEISRECEKIFFKEMKRLADENPCKYLYIKENLYLDRRMTIPMVLVMNTDNPNRLGFKRKGNGGVNNNVHYRCENESFSHLANKEIISELNSFDIFFSGNKVRIHVREAYVEEDVICNDTQYRVDILFLLRATEPAEYLEMWNGKLYFEIFHTCAVDSKQATDFAIQGEPLFEYKIPKNFEFCNNITEEGYEKWKNILIQKYLKNGIKGFLYSEGNINDVVWERNNKEELQACIGTLKTRIIKSKFNEGEYGIAFDGHKLIWQYKKGRFNSEEQARRVAQLVAFEIFNERTE